MPEQRETETITGTVDSIIQKGESKWQAVVMTPEAGQYGRKLWTKSEAQHALITSLLGQQATFECGVSHWEKDGKPVTSLWINAVNPGEPPPQATGSPVTASQPSVTGGSGGKWTAPAKDATRDSIERQTSLIQAVAFFAGTNPKRSEILDVAEDFYAYLTFTNAGRAHAPIAADEDIPF